MKTLFVASLTLCLSLPLFAQTAPTSTPLVVCTESPYKIEIDRTPYDLRVQIFESGTLSGQAENVIATKGPGDSVAYATDMGFYLMVKGQTGVSHIVWIKRPCDKCNGPFLILDHMTCTQK